MLDSHTPLKSSLKWEPSSPVLQSLTAGDSIAVCSECKGVLFGLHITDAGNSVRTYAPVCLNCKTRHDPLISV